MSKTLAAERFELGVDMWAQETTRPDAGGGTAAQPGSLWQRAGGDATQLILKVGSPDIYGWVIQNLVNLSIFNVKTYGAVGNGVTDDTAAINAAVTAANAAGGGVVYFPAVNLASGESYRVTKPASNLGSIYLNNKSKIVFMGDGYASKISMIGSAAGGDWFMFRAVNGSNHLRWWNLHFDGSGITSPDPNDQHHFISLEGIAADGVGVSDIEIRECFMGPIVGDMVRNLGSFPAVVENVRMLYNIQDADHCRSFCEAQRGTKRIQVAFNWMFGSDDQDVDFEPTGGGTSEAPEEWIVLGNQVNHQSRGTDSFTISGIASTQPALRNTFAYNVICNGGQISGLDVNACDIAGNCIVVNNSISDGVVNIFRVGENVRIAGNVLVATNAVSGRAAVKLASNTALAPTRTVVNDNVLVCNEGTGVKLECRDILVAHNIIVPTNAVAGTVGGVGDDSIVDDIDHVSVIGNLILAGNANLSIGINFHAQSGHIIRNTLANYNYVKGCASGVVWNRAGSEVPLDWRACCGNLVTSATSATISISPTTSGLAIDGNASPGDQIIFQNLAAGPEGNVNAAKGSLLTNAGGGQADTIFYKDAGDSSTTTFWARDGACELLIGALASSTATAARFLAPGGMALTAESTVEIQIPVPRPGTIRNLRIKNVAGVGVANVTYTVRKNGADTTLAATMLNTATSASDTTHSFTVVAGDLISVKVTKDTAPGTPQTFVQVTFELTA